MFQDMDRKATMFFECAFVATNSGDLFNTDQMEEGLSYLVNLDIGVWDVLATM
jgi:hypothetical protein